MSYTTYVQDTTGAIADGLRSGREIAIDTVDVLRNVARVLVPISVAGLPARDRLIPSLDATVDRGYDALTRAVGWQYDRAVAALDLLGRVGA